MEKDEEKTNAIEFALLSQRVDSIHDRVIKNTVDIQKVEEKQNSMSKRVDIFEGGVTWVYKGVFVITALLGAFLAFLKVK